MNPLRARRLRTVGASRERAAEAGFALVIVLGLMALLAGVSMILAGSVRAHVRAASKYAAQARAKTLADGGITAAIADLRRNRTKLATKNGRASSSGPILCSLGDHSSIAVRVVNTGGRIDLNKAPASLFEALLAGLGVDAGRARDIGTEVENYRAARSAALARDAAKVDPTPLPFDSEEAIGQIAGMTPRLTRAMMPYVTVYSGLNGLDLGAVDTKLLALLNGGDGTSLPLNFGASSSRQAFIISVVARSADGGVYGQEAVVRISQDKRFPLGVEVRSWRPAVLTADMTPLPGGEGPPCTTDGLFTVR